MTRKSHERRCPECAATDLKVIETRCVAVDDADGNAARRAFAQEATMADYTRRRRVCNSCGHRFTTIEVGQEQLDALSKELQLSRESAERYKSALVTLAECTAPSSPLAQCRHWPQPIPVDERLPGPEDCQFNPGATIGFCWCWFPPENSFSPGYWAFWPLEFAEDPTHWLPANALPLPQ